MGKGRAKKGPGHNRGGGMIDGEVMTNQKTVRLISLGAGVQSSFLYRANALGILGEVAVAAIFADTGDEPQSTHDTLSLLERDHGDVIPIYRVSAGVLSEDWYTGAKSRRAGNDELSMGASIPLFLLHPDGSRGMSQSRSCTSRYKISPLRAKQRAIMEEYHATHVDVLMGISLDEVQRMRQSDVLWASNHYPLIMDNPIRRGEIIRWHEVNGYPIPQRSSCVQCPFHSDKEWRELSKQPKEWAKAVAIDERLRAENRFVSVNADPEKAQYRGIPFLHKSCKPLSEIDFDEDDGQVDMWLNDCSGLCGV
jgi:hypothetical protein